MKTSSSAQSVRPFRCLVAALASLACGAAASAQCSLESLPGNAFAGIRGDVDVMRQWDPDGAGPASPLVVAGGSFALVGAVDSPNCTAFDPQRNEWLAIGQGVVGRVHAVQAMANGDLIVAGDVTSASGTSVNRIARWNGSTWTALGTGFNATVWSLVRTANDHLIAAGSFRALGDGTPMLSIAEWDGIAWSQLGGGLGSGAFAVAVAPNGDVIAGGVFDQAGGVPATRIARWNGSAWSSIGSGFTSHVFSLLVMPNGNIVAATEFAPYVQQWNGTAWSSLGLTPNTVVMALELAANGDVIVGGDFTSILGGVPAAFVARWNGANWFTMGRGAPSRVRTLCVMPGGNLAVGSLRSPVNRTDPMTTRWDGATWSYLGAGIDQAIQTVARLPNGDVVAGGAFTTIGGVAANGIARWDGTNWHPLGSGVDGVVRALQVLPAGDLIAGGAFGHAGGVTAVNIARWNGTAWSALGIGVGNQNLLQQVVALASMPNGDIVAAGAFSSATNGDGGLVASNNIVRWDGAAWHALGSGIVYNPFFPQYVSLDVLQTGELFAAGSLTQAGGANTTSTAIWDGATWRAGPATQVVTATESLASGDVVLGTSSGPIQVLHNGATSPIGTPNGLVTSLGLAPNGDLVAAGNFTSIDGVPLSGLARWNGGTWSNLGSGVPPGSNVLGICSTGAGELALGGTFTAALGQPSVYFARIRSTCQASAPASGAGCSGSYGPVTLVADSLPWLAHPYHLTATGFGPNSFAIWFSGTSQPALPLSAVHPAGLPGCTLWASLEVELGFDFPVGGVSASSVFVPNLPALVGLTFYKQVADVEVDGNLAITAVATSNGLQLQVGSF